jgi:hypothetical protein
MDNIRFELKCKIGFILEKYGPCSTTFILGSEYQKPLGIIREEVQTERHKHELFVMCSLCALHAKDT